MPTSTTPAPSRKSSIGPAGRRGPQKAHIPFRVDDLEHGTKTGIPVTYVDHKSDDFESFGELMQQADGKTPAPKKKRKKSLAAVEQDDGDGEMSMELDDTGAASPMAYFSQNPKSPTPSARRVLGQSSSRPVPRRSSVDFDSVPSPKSVRPPRTSGIRPSNGAGPSNLSRSTVAADVDMDRDESDQPTSSFDKSAIMRRKSFSALGQDDEEEEEHEEIDVTTPVKVNGKSKSRPPSPPVPASPDEGADVDMDLDMGGDMEDDFAQGLHDLDDKSSDSQEEEAPPTKKGKKGKGKQVELEPEEMDDDDDDREPTPKPKPKSKVKREKRIQLPRERSPTPEGVRRSKRHRFRPLEFWRQEKVVYGRRESGLCLVPHIKEIIRIPQDAPQPLGKLGKRKRRGASRAKSESHGLGAKEDEEQAQEVWNPEEGWDDDTDPFGMVLDYVTKKEVRKRIAAPARTIDPKPAANAEWFFQKVFGDGDFIAAGQLRIPPKSRKPSKGTKDNTYIFYLIEGAVNLKVHETTRVLATGAMFIIPRGNTYLLENIGERDAKLFFTQARQVPLDEEEEEEEGTIGARRSSESMPRSRRASTGAPASSGGVGGAKLKRAASTKV